MTTMSDDNDNNAYAIIQFIGKYKSKLLDLVPGSWVMSIKGQLLCKFPNRSEHQSLINLVKNSSSPKSTWRHYKVKILQNAKNYEQGLRRLGRLEVDASVVSSSAENNKENGNPNEEIIPIAKETEEELFKLPGFTNEEIIQYSSSNSSSSEDESEDSNSAPPAKKTKLNDPHKGSEKIRSPATATLTEVAPRTIVETPKLNPRVELTQREYQSLPNKSHTSRRLQFPVLPNVPEPQPVQAVDVADKPGRSTPTSSSVSEVQFELAMARLEKTMLAKMEGMRRSLAYDIQKYADEVKTAIITQLGESGLKPVVNLENELQMTFPIKTPERFEEFEETLLEASKEALMVQLMSTWCSSISVSHAVAAILGRLSEKEVQLKYSGVGKKANHGGKKNFSATKSFCCMKSVICNKLAGSTVIEITKATTTWLARADDRKGGRKSRSLANPSTQQATNTLSDAIPLPISGSSTTNTPAQSSDN